MNKFEKLVSEIARNGSKLEGNGLNDYVKNGLIFCGSCNTQKQCRVKFCGVQTVFPTVCDCQQKREYERQQTEKLEAKIRDNRQQATVNSQFTFRNDSGENRKLTIIAKKYCLNWGKAKNKNIGLLFWGGCGTGKTFMAGCIANELLNIGESVLFVNFAKIVNDMQDFSKKEFTKYFLSKVSAYDLVVFDDFGAERKNEFAQEVAYNVINERYQTGKPMIVTTNMLLKDLTSLASDISMMRIYSRILECCMPIECSGYSIRKTKTSEKRKLACELLGGE